MTLPPGPYRIFNCYGCWRVEGQLGAVVMSGFDEDDATMLAQVLNEREAMIRVAHAACAFEEWHGLPNTEGYDERRNELLGALAVWRLTTPTTPKAKP